MTILEFNESQQMFHYNEVVNSIPKSEEETFGWKKLLVCENDAEASFFANFLQVQFIERGFSKFDDLKFTVDNLIDFVGYREAYLNKYFKKLQYPYINKQHDR
jgi:hypothetical protein